MKKYSQPTIEVISFHSEVMMLEMSKDKTVSGEADIASQGFYWSDDLNQDEDF